MCWAEAPLLSCGCLTGCRVKGREGSSPLFHVADITLLISFFDDNQYSGKVMILQILFHYFYLLIPFVSKSIQLIFLSVPVNCTANIFLSKTYTLYYFFVLIT